MLRRSTLVRQITCARLPSAILASWSKQASAAAARASVRSAMFLLQLIHDLANGKYVDSPRDAKQLALIRGRLGKEALIWNQLAG